MILHVRPLRALATCALAIAAATIAGCIARQPGAYPAPASSREPGTGEPRFAVLAYDQTRTQISLLDATGAPLSWIVDGARTDVWVTALTRWDPMLAPRGITQAATLPWNPSGGPWVTTLVPIGAREIVRFPFESDAPIETRTQPDLAGDLETTGGEVLDVVLWPPETPDETHTFVFALRAAGTTPAGASYGEDVLVIDLGDDPTATSMGAIVQSIPLAGAGGIAGPVTPTRMVRVHDRLLIGMRRMTPPVAMGAPPSFGPGAFVVVDPKMLRVVSTYELPDLIDCGQIDAIDDPDDPDGIDRVEVVVACAGASADVDARTATSGIFDIAADRHTGTTEEPLYTILGRWLATSHPGSMPTRSLVALPGHSAAVVADGDLDLARNDVLFVVDLDASPIVYARVADAALVQDQISGLGTGAYLPDDATMPWSGGLLAWGVGRRGILERRVEAPEGTLHLCDTGAGHDVGCASTMLPGQDPNPLHDNLFVRDVRVVGVPPTIPTP